MDTLTQNKLREYAIDARDKLVELEAQMAIKGLPGDRLKHVIRYHELLVSIGHSETKIAKLINKLDLAMICRQCECQ